MNRRRFAFALFVVAAAVSAVAAAAEGPPPLGVTTAKLAAGKEPVKVVCFGDSVTGLYYHTGGRRTYTDMVGIALKRAYPKADLTTINAGISGHTTVNALDRIERDVLSHQPTLVTVMFGLNDMVRVPIDDYAKNLATIIEKCRAAGAEVLLCTPNSVISTAGRPTEKLVEYCDVVRRVAGERQVPLCDCYAAFDAVRERDPRAWRLLLSDAIHPNMDGHQLIAEEIARSVSGKPISLADVGPPSPAIPKTLSLLKEGKPLKVVAMQPFDELISASLKQFAPAATVEIVSWPAAGLTLPQLAQDAKDRVRKLKPDLVIIAVPRTATASSDEEFINSYASIMNTSLSFGRQEWDCVVVHPSVADAERSDAAHDDLLRQLVLAQDLSLVDRRSNDSSSAAEILLDWLKRQRAQE